MITEISLPNDRFNIEKLSNLKQKNFIFGKNGTGKSSITQAIAEQYSETNDVRIFQGFEKVIAENGGLNAIALGRENAELQPKIAEKQKEIEKINKDITKSEFKEENTYSILENKKKAVDSLSQEIERFYSKSASKLKNNHTDWTGPNYNKRSFQRDIENAEILSEEKLEEAFQIFNQHTKHVEKINYGNLDINKYLEAVNDIITKDISKSVLLTFDTDDEMNWVKQGLFLHENKSTCSFCGAELNEKRLDDLNNYFNDEVKIITSRIAKAVSKIDSEKKFLKSIPKIDNEVDALNLQLSDIKIKYNEFFDQLINSLEKREKNVFIKLEALDIPVPNDFKIFKENYEKLFSKNQDYHRDLSEIKKTARDRLRLNEVKVKLNAFDFDTKILALKNLNKEKELAQEQFDSKKKELEIAKKELFQLQSQTVDESIAVAKINKYLKYLGNQSFSLVHISEDNQKGQYQILGYDNQLRDISTLSTGEKNIVAFLWFILDLENLNYTSNRDMIIVFDDPMNSNDDTVQYLIITRLQQLLKQLTDYQQLFILTHNVHFYINVRYQWWSKGSSKKSTYHLVKNGPKSDVRIINSKQEDLKTSYEAMWEEVRWLYDQHKPDFMLNPLRRIFETYEKFNAIDDLYGEDVETKKLFNVNSHSIDDFEVDLSGKDETEIINKVKNIFEKVGALEHFNKYWGRD